VALIVTEVLSFLTAYVVFPEKLLAFKADPPISGLASLRQRMPIGWPVNVLLKTSPPPTSKTRPASALFRKLQAVMAGRPGTYLMYMPVWMLCSTVELSMIMEALVL